jgi:glyoxylase-like metal-dependent hydrolase (beta-lactamase superfamily II)
MQKTLDFESKHFIPHALAEGIFAAIAVNGGSAICNSGLIDLGEQILVFDTFLTPQAAMDLRRLATEIYGRTPQIVINSHYHNDHIWGNQVFASEALVISSARTRELIATEGMEEFQWYSSNSAHRLESLRAQYQNTNDERQQQELLLWIGEYGGVVEAMPGLAICMPGITFSNRLEIHGLKRTAELITFEGAHTGSDTVLYLPQDGIVFMSDLLFVGFHPYLGDGDPLGLLNALRELSLLEANCFVPGHGSIGTIEDVKLLISYIESCIETARGLIDMGNISPDAIKELKIPVTYEQWQVSQFYTTNISFLCERLSSKDKDKQAPC